MVIEVLLDNHIETGQLLSVNRDCFRDHKK
jgi:hypothetical protein